MADKKKNPSQSATRMQSRNRNRMAASKVRSDEMATPKADGDEKEQSKDVKAVTRDRDERKVQESKPVRRENKSQSKGPRNWQVRLRSNRSIRFVLDAYYELIVVMVIQNWIPGVGMLRTGLSNRDNLAEVKRPAPPLREAIVLHAQV